MNYFLTTRWRYSLSYRARFFAGAPHEYTLITRYRRLVRGYYTMRHLQTARIYAYLQDHPVGDVNDIRAINAARAAAKQGVFS